LSGFLRDARAERISAALAAESGGRGRTFVRGWLMRAAYHRERMGNKSLPDA
jgi:hypothetical protein